MTEKLKVYMCRKVLIDEKVKSLKKYFETKHGD